MRSKFSLVKYKTSLMLLRISASSIPLLLPFFQHLITPLHVPPVIIIFYLFFSLHLHILITYQAMVFYKTSDYHDYHQTVIISDYHYHYHNLSA